LDCGYVTWSKPHVHAKMEDSAEKN